MDVERRGLWVSTHLHSYNSKVCGYAARLLSNRNRSRDRRRVKCIRRGTACIQLAYCSIETYFAFESGSNGGGLLYDVLRK